MKDCYIKELIMGLIMPNSLGYISTKKIKVLLFPAGGTYGIKFALPYYNELFIKCIYST